ncbi:hypothetical protein A2U01_0066251, partial [Trifolium medium]|nr:hypothetical protein [Trifolium medium]
AVVQQMETAIVANSQFHQVDDTTASSSSLEATLNQPQNQEVLELSDSSTKS